MGTTADKLNKLLNTKQAIKQAIVDKGIEVGDDTKFSDYPAKIESIVTEGVDPWFETMWNAITNNNTDYSYLFSDYNGTTLDVSNLDTSNVTDMSYMFNFCKNLTTLDASNFNTSKVTTMKSMFYYCPNLIQLDVSNWDTSNVINMGDMFYNCYKLTELDVSNWNTSNVTDIGGVFYNCSSLTSLDVSNWDTSKATDISNIFNGCAKLTSLDLSNWDISKVTSNYSLGNAFNSCTVLADFKAPKNINANMDVQKSKALTHDSLMSIINNLMAVTSTKTLTLGTDNLAKLTADEIAIATNKGWTVK